MRGRLVKNLFFLVIGMGLALACAAQAAEELSGEPLEEIDTSEDELYLEARAPFDEAGLFETRIFGGVDVNNPYFTFYSVSAAESLRLSQFFSVGIQGTKFFPVLRTSTQSLQDRLGQYGFSADLRQPDWSAVGVFGITPLSGMISFFGGKVLMMDISLQARAGVIRYLQEGNALTAGLGLEFHTGILPNFGLNLGVTWDVDRIAGTTGISRVGLRFGPTVRF